jgi:hypothetical protein
MSGAVMEAQPCAPEEDVLRGIMTTNWDVEGGRLRQSFFEGQGISVSRLSVSDRETLIAVFKKELPRPPDRLLMGTVRINVGDLQQIGRNYVAQSGNKRVPKPTELTVVPKPTTANPAHAEIRENITRGLAGDIRAHLENNNLIELWHNATGGGA